MIPILYDSTETVFADNGLGRLRDCISCIVTEERNGEYTCDFEYPVDGVQYDKIQLGRIIGVEHDDTNDVQPFDIVSCERPINGVVTFHCQHISYRLSGIVASGTNITSLADALTMLSNGVPSQPFSFSADFESGAYMSSADGIPRSVRQFLGGIEGSILDAYGGEYEFDTWDVILHRSRGVARNLTIRYGVNLVDYNETLDYSESFNMAVPYWKGTDEIVVGGVVDSGGTSYSGTAICVPLDLSEKFESTPTVEALEAMALSLMHNNNSFQPKQNIKVDFIRLQDMPEYAHYKNLLACKLCDTIRLEFPRYGVEGTIKIVKTVWDVLQERYESLELGSLSTTLSEALGIGDSSAGSSASAIDYVTEQTTEAASDGTSWKIRKWKSGTVELWARKQFASVPVTTSSAAYGGYRSAVIEVSLPASVTLSASNSIDLQVTKSISHGAWLNYATISSSYTAVQAMFSAGSSMTETSSWLNVHLTID